jgi:hypothetical protein
MPIRIGIAETQNSLEDCRYFEYRSVLHATDAGAVRLEPARHRVDALADRFERIQHDADAVLLHPLRVVALLRHGPGVAHDDDGQLLLDGFADAAGPGLADEEIAQLHEIADVRGKSDDRARCA